MEKWWLPTAGISSLQCGRGHLSVVARVVVGTGGGFLVVGCEAGSKRGQNKREGLPSHWLLLRTHILNLQHAMQ